MPIDQLVGSVILIVDDNLDLLNPTAALLRHGGYRTIAASGSLEALNQARASTGDIHILLTDVSMPEMDGIALSRQILSIRPGIRVLLMSGESAVHSEFPVLRKPFSKTELFSRLADLLNGLPTAVSSICQGRDVPDASGRTTPMSDLDQVRSRYLNLSRELLELTKAVPTGIPHPDGVMRIRRIRDAQRRAFEKYQELLKRQGNRISPEEKSPTSEDEG